LDVVRKEIESLNGAVELRFAAGVGSTWTLRLPLTLSISEAILAEVRGTLFAFPLNFIESGLVLDGPTSCRADGREVYEIQSRRAEDGGQKSEVRSQRAEDGGQTSDLGSPTSDLGALVSEWLPVVRLSKLFQMSGGEGAHDAAAQTHGAESNKGLIVSVGDRRAIVVVDVVLKRQEIVIKQLDSVMALHPLLNGATLDAEGRVIPILNLPTLLKFGEQQSGVRSQKSEARPRTSDLRAAALRVLIVDDSLSVRKVQERYLTELGCQVTVASDGLYALEKLREQDFEFVFTDLEMPRLNGYELISELRGNPVWASIPIVVISSRGADKYITKAMNLGATTFLSKPFTQEQLKQVLGHYSKVAEA
jgi:chemosensory pili system protein ChpA (sensor histidine kinase/response regulator)